MARQRVITAILIRETAVQEAATAKRETISYYRAVSAAAV
jgi:hypothetical protein